MTNNKRRGDPTIYVLYHGNDCSDGLGARYAAWKEFGDRAEYIPVQHNEPLPKMDLTRDSEVYIVDFSYTAHVLLHLKSKCKLVKVIDHHLSNYDDFIDDLVDLYLGYKVCNGLSCETVKKSNVVVKQLKLFIKNNKWLFNKICNNVGIDPPIFNMYKSGALLTWEYFHGNVIVPDIIKYVSDRDLREYKLRKTRAIIEGLFFSGLRDSLEYWDALANDKSVLEDCVNKGYDILRFKTSIINGYKKRSRYNVIYLLGRRVAVFNACEFIDELSESFYTDKKLNVEACMTFNIGRDGTARLSFRSNSGSDVNVIPLAEYWGGGGHFHNSGASLNIENTVKLLKMLNK